MAKTIMIQGTMSSAGKSLVCTGLCRVFQQDGYKVAPFKSQNMTSNVFITPDGLIMSRIQAVQAEAASITASVLMNPILYRPATSKGSELILNGVSRGLTNAVDYLELRQGMASEVMTAFTELAANYDIIVIEGAGSPAEINLKQDDIVNMGLAKMCDSPVLLVGDISCGGIFAQIVGTLVLLEADERERVKGSIVNKFRGDIELFRTGITMLEEKSGKPVVGVLPYLDVCLEAEDSFTRTPQVKSEGLASTSNSVAGSNVDSAAFRDSQYNLVAAAIREHLNLPYIYQVLEKSV